MRALALSRENLGGCLQYTTAAVEKSVQWKTEGSGARLFTIQGQPRAFKDRNNLGRVVWFGLETASGKLFYWRLRVENYPN